jgi:4-hydroxybenzoate polyprenyltransferase
MIKFSHTVFALPFALSAVILAHQATPVTLSVVFWIVIAMIGARSAAMGFNRIADAKPDAQNPRTADREIPKGTISRTSAIVFVLLFSLVFILASAFLGKICFYLSFPVLCILFFYSYAKRFTWLCHLYLGFAISLAPIGAWIAVTGSITPGIFLLSLGLMTYIAGFDILYACQDMHFDKTAGLFSIPASFGIETSLFLAKLLHVIAVLFLLLLYPVFHLGRIYLFTVLIIAILFFIEHRLVNPKDLSKINIAFFHINSIISVILFIGIFTDIVIRW